MRIQQIKASFIITLNRFIPKHWTNNRVLVFCDMGIGDLVMFMPTIKALHDNGYNLTFDVTRQPQSDILLKHFPCSSHIVKGVYGYSLNNFHTIRNKAILKIMRLRIPNRVGHAYNKYSKFFNHPAYFSMGDSIDQIEKNYLLYAPFGSMQKVKLFFDVQPYHEPMKDYLLVQPFSSTNSKKNRTDREWIHDILNSGFENVLFIGCEREIIDIDRLCHQVRTIGKLKHVAYQVSLNIFEAAYCIKNARQFYCLDSGLSHIAAALGTPTVVYYKRSITPSHVIHKSIKTITYRKLPTHAKRWDGL